MPHNYRISAPLLKKGNHIKSLLPESYSTTAVIAVVVVAVINVWGVNKADKNETLLLLRDSTYTIFTVIVLQGVSSAIGIRIRPSVCNAVHSGAHGRCTELMKVVPWCS